MQGWHKLSIVLLLFEKIWQHTMLAKVARD